MVFSLIIPFMKIIFVPLISCMKKTCCLPKESLKNLKNRYLGPEFDFIGNYVFVLNQTVVSFIYCNGMPLLLFLGAFTLYVHYAVEKFLGRFLTEK